MYFKHIILVDEFKHFLISTDDAGNMCLRIKMIYDELLRYAITEDENKDKNKCRYIVVDILLECFSTNLDFSDAEVKDMIYESISDKIRLYKSHKLPAHKRKVIKHIMYDTYNHKSVNKNIWNAKAVMLLMRCYVDGASIIMAIRDAHISYAEGSKQWESVVNMFSTLFCLVRSGAVYKKCE